MKSSLSSCLGLALVAADYADAVGFPRAQAGKGYLSIPVSSQENKNKQKRDDDDSIDTTLLNKQFFYATEIELGNPGQSVTVLVDTGSSELWVNPECDTASTAEQEKQCESFGQYNPKKSNTPPVGPFGSEVINYGDPTDESTQTSVDIVYYSDDLGWPDNDAQVSNQTFGVVTDSKGQSQGILGLAPDLQAGFDGQSEYSLLLNTIAEQGLIESRVFSLDLRHSSSDTGSLVYGAVDKSRFTGDLHRMPLAPGIQGEARLGANIKSFGMTVKGKSQSVDLAEDDQNMMLDSGTSLSRLHSSLLEPIIDALDAQPVGDGTYYLDCDLRDQDASVDFGFDDKIIKVAFKDFILDIGARYCYAGAVETVDQQILGDTVLRAGYFVFDWDNQELHVAQAASCGDPDLVVVGSGSDAVGDLTGNCKESDSLDDGSGSSGSADSNGNGSGSGSGDDDGGDSAGVRSQSATGLVALFGVAAVLYNVL